MPNNTLEKWEEKQLKDICDFHNGLWTGKKEPFIECNVIRNANFTKDFKLNYDNVVKINVEERQFQTRELEYLLNICYLYRCRLLPEQSYAFYN